LEWALLELPLGLTYDDVVLIPQRSALRSRRDADPTGRFSRRLVLRAPIASANMDTVTEWRMAIAMAEQGGIGVLHRFMPIAEQVEQVQRVKRHEPGYVVEPETIGPDASLAAAAERMSARRVSSLLVVDDAGRLLGILSRRDLRPEGDSAATVAARMTPRAQLVTANVGVALNEARALLDRHRLEKLPIVDERDVLRGLITERDLARHAARPAATRDARGRLVVAAAVGAVGDYRERAAALAAEGVDALVIDIAHGHSDLAIEAAERVRADHPQVELVVGNVATPEGARDLAAAGADAVKVGVGPGAACTTRIVAGAGVPQLSAVYACAKALADTDVPVIADGGIRQSGDVVKALAAGAGCVMIGQMLAGTAESPGETVVRGGRRYKVYRGMASRAAARARWLREREGEDLDELAQAVTPEGVETVVPFRGPVADVLRDLIGGLRSGMSYCNARTLDELRANARFLRVTEAGRREGLPHALDALLAAGLLADGTAAEVNVGME
jgi:IMP dehydrogenase